MGLEHEMHIFHIPVTPNATEKIKNIVLYDSYEVLTDIIINHSDEMTPQQRKYAKDTWTLFEPSGRFCGGHWVLKGTGTKMPEFVTGDPFSYPNHRRYMKDFVDELFLKEMEFYEFVYDFYPKAVKQGEKWGPVVNYPYGMTNYIKIPKSSKAINYIFEKTKQGVEKLSVDYTGSYHITITLPHTKQISLKKFVSIHKNFANQLQWLEPLLIPPFFSADDKAMGTKQKRVYGSYRVMRVGWGNFAGTDIRKLDKGIGRYSNIKNEWRKGLDFFQIDKLKYCEDTPRTEPGAISSLSSDFRTFGATDPRRPWHRESGAPMTLGNGIEFRIFDNFDTRFLYDLCKLIAYIAENSRKHTSTAYVYNNKSWKEALQRIMKRGWLAELPKTYVDILRKQLNLKIKTKSLRAEHVIKVIAKELYQLHKNGLWTKLMLNDNKPIEIPDINRKSWELGFMLKAHNTQNVLNKYNKLLVQLCYTFETGTKTIELKTYQKYFDKIFGAIWKDDWLNVAYLMESEEAITITKTKIKINKESCDLRYDFNDLIQKLLSNRQQDETIRAFDYIRNQNRS